jgi:hypothetical protein
MLQPKPPQPKSRPLNPLPRLTPQEQQDAAWVRRMAYQPLTMHGKRQASSRPM